MKKITLSIFLIIICNFLNSQNNPSIRLKIGELVDNTPVFTVNTSALKIAYENALELEENSIEYLKIIQLDDDNYSLDLICKNNIKISLTLFNKNGFEIEVGTVQTTCSGLNCNGCCVMTDVCTVCVANGSANNGTCTRRVIGPIINFFDPENLKK